MTVDYRYNILVTSSMTVQQEQYAQKLGLNPWVVPALRVEFPHNWKKFVKKMDQYPQAVWVFTSRNAVEGLKRMRDSEYGTQRPASVEWNPKSWVQGKGDQKQEDPSKRKNIIAAWDRAVFAVGEKTAEALKELNFVVMNPYKQSAEGLASLIEKQFETDKPVVLHWCGNRRRDQLGDQLKKAGFEYIDMEVYQTELNAIPWPEREPDAILFYSPSGVEAFRQSGGFKRPLPELFAIGSTTGEALSLESGKNVHIPSKPSTEALLELTSEILGN